MITLHAALTQDIQSGLPRALPLHDAHTLPGAIRILLQAGELRALPRKPGETRSDYCTRLLREHDPEEASYQRWQTFTGRMDMHGRDMEGQKPWLVLVMDCETINLDFDPLFSRVGPEDRAELIQVLDDLDRTQSGLQISGLNHLIELSTMLCQQSDALCQPSEEVLAAPDIAGRLDRWAREFGEMCAEEGEDPEEVSENFDYTAALGALLEDELLRIRNVPRTEARDPTVQALRALGERYHAASVAFGALELEASYSGFHGQRRLLAEASVLTGDWSAITHYWDDAYDDCKPHPSVCIPIVGDTDPQALRTGIALLHEQQRIALAIKHLLEEAPCLNAPTP